MLVPELDDLGRRNLSDARQLHQLVGGCRVDVYATLILIRRSSRFRAGGRREGGSLSPAPRAAAAGEGNRNYQHGAKDKQASTDRWTHDSAPKRFVSSFRRQR